jgi:hypothetical protein
VKKLTTSLAFMVTLLISSEVQAYSFTVDYNQGLYWQNFPIPMQVIVANGADGAQLQSFTEDTQQEWEDSIGVVVWDINPSFQVSSNPTGNNVRWSFNFAAETGYDPVNTLAVAVRYNQGTYIVKTEIILNGELIELRNNINGLLYKTLLHEFGHTVGLDHSTNTAMMQATLNNLSTLQADDVAGFGAVISDTKNRQATGFVGNLGGNGSQSNAKETVAGCGMIEVVNSSGPGSGGPGSGLILSFILGLVLTRLPTKVASKVGVKA